MCIISFSSSAVRTIGGIAESTGSGIRHSGFEILSLPTSDRERGQICFLCLFWIMGMEIKNGNSMGLF